MDESVKESGRWTPFPNPLKTYGLNDMGEAFRGQNGVPVLVRESIQNALDAKSAMSEHVKVEFGYSQIDPHELPGWLRLLQIFIACKNFTGRASAKEKKFFADGEELLRREKIGMLSISDYGTCGLRGAKTNEPKSRWKGLVMTTGAGNDEGGRGGGFGLGKEAMFLASGLRTLFFSTIDDQDRFAAHMGVGYLATFNWSGFKGNQQADRTVFYCSENYNSDDETSNPAIEGTVKFSSRKDDEFGTDVYIPGFEYASDMDALSAEILNEALKSFIIAIDAGELVVSLPNGKCVGKENLGVMVDWVGHFVNAADQRLVQDLYQLTKAEWRYSDKIVVDLGIDSFPARAFAYKFIPSETTNKCFVTREKGMVVHTIADVCDSATAVGFCKICDANLNAVFKAMENAAHAKFGVSTGRFPEKSAREVAKKQLKKLESCAKEWAEKQVGVEIKDETSAVLPDELEEILNACAGQFTIGDVKAKAGKSVGIGGVRIKKHKRKNASMTKAESAGPSSDDDASPDEPYVPHSSVGKKGRKKGDPVASGRSGDSNAPEKNGFALRSWQTPPTFFTSSCATAGRYRFVFTPPKDKAKVCVCFSSTTEKDSREGLKVKSVAAKSAEGDVVAYADLGDTVVAFENVKAGQPIEADIEFDVDHYCYAEIRYYEKKNV